MGRRTKIQRLQCVAAGEPGRHEWFGRFCDEKMGLGHQRQEASVNLDRQRSAVNARLDILYQMAIIALLLCRL